MSSRVWLITGTSSGFGAEFVKAALSRGDNVIATARNAERIAHLEELGASIMQLDVTASPDELTRKANEAISIYGGLDVLVNNAGYTHFGTIEETSYDEWLGQFDTNFFGTLKTTQAILPHFRAKRSGTVVFIGSSVAWQAFPVIGSYCASKAALHYAVESLSQEIALLGVKTLLVEPGAFRTKILSATNTKSTTSSLSDYKALTEATLAQFASFDGNQMGDTGIAAERVVDVVRGEGRASGKEWPSCLVLGSDAVGMIRKKCEDTLRQLGEWEEFSSSTDL